MPNAIDHAAGRPRAEEDAAPAPSLEPVADDPGDPLSLPARIDLESRELDDDLLDVRRAVDSLRSRGLIHPSHPASEGASPHFAAAPAGAKARQDGDRRSGMRKRSSGAPAESGAGRAGSALSWLLLPAGVMAFVCGGVLVAWSYFSGRADLWTLGLPLLFAGQAGLILGLIFQLDGLWRDARRTGETLGELDEQLDELRHATHLLTLQHGNNAQSFYLHLAEKANPEMLLADLKGQMDLLAMRLANERRR